MIRNMSRAALLAAAVVTAGTAFVNCSKNHTADDIGSIQLALTLSPGVIINTVTYTISGNGITPINGSIDVTGSTTANATAFVSGLPVANNYLVTMHADSTDNLTHCDGQANFNVLLNATAMANVTLQCKGTPPPTGQVAVNGRLDNCPFITALSANRLQAAVGQSITVNVSATDYDAADTITYAWTAVTTPATGVGSLGTPAAAMTTFNCTGVGTAQLSIVISDGVCGETRTNAIPLTCVAGTTGAGGAGGGAAGTGGGAAGTGGSAAGTGGSAAGTGGSAAGTGGSAAGTGGSAGGTGGTGGSTMVCEEGSNGAACTSCTLDQCALGPTPGTDGCCGLTNQADIDLCNAVYACIRQNQCSASGDPTKCFCGTATSATCFVNAGAADGVCLQQYFAASKTTDPVTIKARFQSPLFPSGRANNLAVCQGGSCSECGIK